MRAPQIEFWLLLSFLGLAFARSFRPSPVGGEYESMGRLSLPSGDSASLMGRGKQTDRKSQEISLPSLARMMDRAAKDEAMPLGIAGMNITYRTAEDDAPNPVSKLYRELRKEAKRRRTAEEEYPDEAAEKQMRRVVRKAATDISNYQSVEKWKAEKEAIAKAEKGSIAGPNGLKMLGYKGDQRFKPENLEKGRPKKPEQRRTAEADVIKKFGELLRDPEWSKRLMDSSKGDTTWLKAERKCAKALERKEEKRIVQEMGIDPSDWTITKKMMKERDTKGVKTSSILNFDESARARPKKTTMRLKGGGPIGLLRLRGGGPAAGGVSSYNALLPTNYDSLTAWVFALIRMALAEILKRLGFTSAGAIAEITPTGGRKQAQTMPKEALAALQKIKFDDTKLAELKRRTVIMVTNNVIFDNSDLVKVFEDPKAPPPRMLPANYPFLLKLAQTSNLFLITELPHSGHQNYTAYSEAVVVPSSDPAAPHGLWVVDRPEATVNEALNKSGVYAAGLGEKHSLYCETHEGRGYIARAISEMADSGPLELYIDDGVQTVDWLQNVLRNTTVIGVKNAQNKGKFKTPKKAAPPVVVSALQEYFEI